MQCSVELYIVQGNVVQCRVSLCRILQCIKVQHIFVQCSAVQFSVFSLIDSSHSLANMSGCQQERITAHCTLLCHHFYLSQYLADPGEARGCSTNTFVIDSLIH